MLTRSLLVLMFFLATGTAQQQQPFTIKIDTQLVVETVVVKDKDGKNLEGLTDKDFTVTEDGVPQTISVFQFQRLEDTPAPASSGGAAQPAAEVVQPKIPTQITAPPPGDSRYRDRRLLVLFFDLMNVSPPDQLRAFTAADKFIRMQMKTPDLVAIMSFSAGSVKVLQDFTNDQDALFAVLQKLIYPDDNDNDTADTTAAFGQDTGEFNVFNTDRQLAALQTAVNMLKTINEQKSLVYFASGLRLNGTDNQAQLRATINAAIRSNVAFFPVDARGLVATLPFGDATRPSPGGIGVFNGNTAMTSITNFQRSQDSLYALASDTGGKALLDNNDLAAGIVQAEQAITSYYVIGYYSSNTNLDGKFQTCQDHPERNADRKIGLPPGVLRGQDVQQIHCSR